MATAAKRNMHVEDREKKLSVNIHPQMQLYHYPVSCIYMPEYCDVILYFSDMLLNYHCIHPQLRSSISNDNTTQIGGSQYVMRGGAVNFS